MGREYPVACHAPVFLGINIWGRLTHIWIETYMVINAQYFIVGGYSDPKLSTSQHPRRLKFNRKLWVLVEQFVWAITRCSGKKPLLGAKYPAIFLGPFRWGTIGSFFQGNHASAACSGFSSSASIKSWTPTFTFQPAPRGLWLSVVYLGVSIGYSLNSINH